MKNKFTIIFIIFSMAIWANFENGDLLELTTALNARSSMNFYSNAKNFVKTLKKDTLLKVEESIEIKNSVNGKGVYGVRVSIHEEGKEQDPKAPSYWVYFDSKLKNPTMKIKEKSKDILERKTLPTVVITAKRKLSDANIALMDKLEPMAGDLAITLKDIQALIDLDDDERAVRLLDMTKAQIEDWLKVKRFYCEIQQEQQAKNGHTSTIISSAETKINLNTKPDIAALKLTSTPLIMENIAPLPNLKVDSPKEEVVRKTELDQTIDTCKGMKFEEQCRNNKRGPNADALTYDVTSATAIAPRRESVTPKSINATCKETAKFQNVDSCFNNETKEISSFRLTNKEGRSLVERFLGKKDREPSRVFQFNFLDLARSDMNLSITDKATENEFGTNNIHMVFLPRKQLPSVKQKGDDTIVTLPNGEELVFDKKTSDIKSGVLKELPQEAAGNVTKRDRFVYNGSGVVITTQANNDEPTSNISEANGKKVKIERIAIIKKFGYKNCKVNVQDLWEYDEKNSATFMKKEFATDEALDKFIKEKCTFSMFD